MEGEAVCADRLRRVLAPACTRGPPGGNAALRPRSRSALNWLGIAWTDSGAGVYGKIKLVDTATGRLMGDHEFGVGTQGTTTVAVTWAVPTGSYRLTICDARKSGGY